MLKVNNGFSLTEILITMLLGSALLTMVISLYVASISTGVKNLQYARLRADLQSIISVMETDIRRAGYGGSEFMVGSGATKTIDTLNDGDQNCIIYSYNHNNSSSISSANKMGFRFHADKKEIQFGTGVNPIAANCYTSGYWKALSDKKFIKISSLSFTESKVSSAVSTMRSVQIEIKGELISANDVEHSILTKVQVRNVEFN